MRPLFLSSADMRFTLNTMLDEPEVAALLQHDLLRGFVPPLRKLQTGLAKTAASLDTNQARKLREHNLRLDFEHDRLIGDLLDGIRLWQRLARTEEERRAAEELLERVLPDGGKSMLKSYVAEAMSALALEEALAEGDLAEKMAAVSMKMPGGEVSLLSLARELIDVGKQLNENLTQLATGQEIGGEETELRREFERVFLHLVSLVEFAYANEPDKGKQLLAPYFERMAAEERRRKSSDEDPVEPIGDTDGGGAEG